VDRAEALRVINNWRSSHAYPLQALKMTLRSRALRVDDQAIVAQRLKRLSSIHTKLENNTNMKLSQMQDIGGCRAVVRTVWHLDELVASYETGIAQRRPGPEFYKRYDYISEPKSDGYRSMHYVYKYFSRSEKHRFYKGLRIEIQLRSALQHAWATAVETVSALTGQALKSNVGEDSWKRFFALMGSSIAARERRPPVPGTPSDSTELAGELRHLVSGLNIYAVLSGWRTAVRMTEEEVAGADTYLLVLDATANTIEVRGFRKHQLQQAADEYLLIETETAHKPEVQAVLVSSDSLLSLRKAYPNYYLDTRAFLVAVRYATRPVGRRRKAAERRGGRKR
jgi:hypothetical protein